MIAVHSGAGNHHYNKHPKYKYLCKKACRAGLMIIKSGGTALDAVTAAVKVLEDDALTNAGYGSNLTTSGQVECDAAIMDGSNLIYGGCGCTTTIKNPIELAYDVCIKQTQPLPVGLIPPSLLVADGATMHAEKYGIKTVKNRALITKRATKKLLSYESVLKQLDSDRDLFKCDNHVSNDDITTDVDVRMDTVGAVCCDIRGHVASGCSSGGLLLKRPGRVGQGALYASGVWADSWKPQETAVAATTSGCGEYLMRTQLAKEVCDDLKASTFPTPDLANCITEKFINSRYLKTATDKNAGALVLHILPSGEGTVLWGHSTTSMAIGFMSFDDLKPKSIVSMLPAGSIQGNSVMVGGSNFKLDRTSIQQNYDVSITEK